MYHTFSTYFRQDDITLCLLSWIAVSEHPSNYVALLQSDAVRHCCLVIIWYEYKITQCVRV